MSKWQSRRGGVHQHLHEAGVGVPVDLVVAAGHAVTRVVDQHVDGAALARGGRDDPPRRVRVFKVVDNDIHTDPMRRAQFGSQGLQPVLAPRGQHQIAASPGELAREFGPDAGRGAGDECAPASVGQRSASVRQCMLHDRRGRGLRDSASTRRMAMARTVP